MKKKEIAGALFTPTSIHICTTDDMHPYECGINCIHCDNKKFEGHDPEKCALCQDD